MHDIASADATPCMITKRERDIVHDHGERQAGSR